MNITVLGASGRAGSEIVKELARRGHQVTGVARNPARIPTGEGITAASGDAPLVVVEPVRSALRLMARAARAKLARAKNPPDTMPPTRANTGAWHSMREI